MLEGASQQADELRAVLGGRHRHVRNGQEVGDVVQAHVRLPILTHHARAVEAEDYGQPLDRDVVDDAVIGALQEGRVDRDHGPDALRGEPRRKGSRMRFRDADVEESVGPLLLERAGAGPGRHRRGDRHELGVFARELGERFTEHGGPLRRTALDRAQLARHGGVGRARVVLLGIRRRQREALPLLRDHVHYARPLERLHDLEGLHHLPDVVTIDRPEVAEAELLEQHSRRPEILDALLHGLGEVHELLAADNVGDRFDQRLHALPDPHRDGARDDGAQVLVDGPDIGGDRHAVVVQDHDDVAAGMARVVHGFVWEPAGEGAVAHHRNHLELLAHQVARRRDAVGGGESGSRVPSPELIVRTLTAPQEPGQAARLAQGGQTLVAPGEDLPGVAPFAAGLATQGVRPVVAIYSTFLQRAYDSIIHDVDQAAAHLVREGLQQILRQRPDVFRSVNPLEQCHVSWVGSQCSEPAPPA